MAKETTAEIFCASGFFFFVSFVFSCCYGQRERERERESGREKEEGEA